MNSISARPLLVLLLMAFLGGMAAYIISIIRNAEPAPAKTVAQECIDPELQTKIRTLALQGFELAFIDRVQLLYDTWTKDPSTAKEHPGRGQVGMQNAIHAYVYARELANNWSAPPCPPKPDMGSP